MPANTLTTMVALVSYVLIDRGSNGARSGNLVFTDTEIQQEVESALYQYSLDCPYQKTVDVTGTDSNFYQLTALSGWIPDFSVVKQIEYPAIDPAADDQTDIPVFLRLDKDIEYYRKAALLYVRFLSATPTTTETIRIDFTTYHVLNATSGECTIPVHHQDALAYLTASRLCRRKMAEHSESGDSTMGVSLSEYRDATLRYRQAGEEFENQYRRLVGLPLVHNGRVNSKMASSAAGSSINWDTTDSQRRDWFGHSNRYR